MSLLTVVQQVCQAVGVQSPQSVFSSIQANRTMQEMLALANEMARRIAYDTREWVTLTTAARSPGTEEVSGITGIRYTRLPLPSNYQRLLLTSQVWRQSVAAYPMRFISDSNEWAQLQLQGTGFTGNGVWVIAASPNGGGDIHIVPPIAAGDNAIFIYLDKNCIKLNSGGFGDAFLSDADTFRLDERLLKLGMTWQWKANKGSPYAEDMATYADALSMVAGADRPSPIIIGRRPVSSYAVTAYPFPLPTSGGP